MTDPPALAFANNLHPTSVRRRSLRHRLSVSDVPAHYHTPPLAVLLLSVNFFPGGVAVNGTPPGI